MTKFKSAQLLNIPDSEYFALDSLDQSQLKAYLRNPKEWAFQRLYPEENKSTPAMQFGTAFHAYMLHTGVVACLPEGETFRSKANQEWKAQHEADGGIVVSYSDMQLLYRMERGLIDASKYDGQPDYVGIIETGLCEQSIEWFDEKSGFKLKAKLDLIPENVDYLVDIKTAQSANPDEFARHAYQLGYAIQAEFYRAAVAQIDPKELNRKTRTASGMQFWVFEKSGACDWAPYTISADSQMADNARHSIRDALNRIRVDVNEAEKQGYGKGLDAAAKMLIAHGGYSKTPRELVFPDWCLREAETFGLQA